MIARHVEAVPADLHGRLVAALVLQTSGGGYVAGPAAKKALLILPAPVAVAGLLPMLDASGLWTFGTRAGQEFVRELVSAVLSLATGTQKALFDDFLSLPLKAFGEKHAD